MMGRISETVSLGRVTIGRIRQTDRGFELFDENDRYLATAMTVREARRYLFQRSKDLTEGAKT